MKNILNCVTIGDPNGIGLELIFRIWKEKRNITGNFFIIGNYDLIKKKSIKKNKLKLIKITKTTDVNKYFNKYLPILDIKSKNENFGTLKSIIESYRLAKLNLITGIVTLPINKEKIIKINRKFIGHTEYYEKLDKKISNMIMFSKNIIIVPLTTHISIKNVNKKLNKDYLKKKINSLIKTLILDLNINKPKIAITGLNPHSGENGKIGLEEKKIIEPVIKFYKRKKIYLSGPYSADSIFLNKNLKKFDCIITMYHDQGLIPFKILNFFEGVNYTGGLNIIRSSPCHGTAYDLVGKKGTKYNSLLNSILLINKVYKNRKNAKKISRSKFFN